jgi:hypothetical protein
MDIYLTKDDGTESFCADTASLLREHGVTQTIEPATD